MVCRIRLLLDVTKQLAYLQLPLLVPLIGFCTFDELVKQFTATVPGKQTSHKELNLGHYIGSRWDSGKSRGSQFISCKIQPSLSASSLAERRASTSVEVEKASLGGCAAGGDQVWPVGTGGNYITFRHWANCKT